MYTTTGARVAITAGTGAMFLTTGGAVVTSGAAATYDTAGAGAMYSTTGAGTMITASVDAMCSQLALALRTQLELTLPWGSG